MPLVIFPTLPKELRNRTSSPRSARHWDWKAGKMAPAKASSSVLKPWKMISDGPRTGDGVALRPQQDRAGRHGQDDEAE
jgi:hypothetical protein